MCRILTHVPFLALALFVLGAGSAEAGPNSVLVIGQNDQAVDRATLQAAVDGASPGTTIELEGTFQLDGERILIEDSFLTLAGRRIDNDGDGAFNEDWGDGLDNDLDGLIDEDGWDATLRGVEDPAGGPATQQGDNALWNRGLVVEGVQGTLRRLRIRDIRFSNFHRAIEIIPEWGSPTGGCIDRFFTGGKVRGMSVERSRFDGNILGLLVLGDVVASRGEGNVFENSGTGGFFVEGSRVDCPLVGGFSIELALATPVGIRITGNRFVEGGVASFFTRWTRIRGNTFVGGSVGILSLSDQFEEIRGNSMEDVAVGIAMSDTTRSLVIDNSIVGGFFGIDLLDNGAHVVLFSNHIEGTFNGLVFELGAQGYFAVNQTFEATLFEDVFLDVDSVGNTVVNTGVPVSALDLGIDNRLIGNFVEP